MSQISTNDTPSIHVKSTESQTDHSGLPTCHQGDRLPQSSNDDCNTLNDGFKRPNDSDTTLIELKRDTPPPNSQGPPEDSKGDQMSQTSGESGVISDLNETLTAHQAAKAHFFTMCDSGLFLGNKLTLILSECGFPSYTTSSIYPHSPYMKQLDEKLNRLTEEEIKEQSDKVKFLVDRWSSHRFLSPWAEAIEDW